MSKFTARVLTAAAFVFLLPCIIFPEIGRHVWDSELALFRWGAATVGPFALAVDVAILAVVAAFAGRVRFKSTATRFAKEKGGTPPFSFRFAKENGSTDPFSFRNNARGNVAIEFAILAPIIALMLGMIIDFGFGLLGKQQLTFATQSAAAATATGGNANGLFEQNVAGAVNVTEPAVACSSTATVATCAGSANYRPFFGGLFTVTTIALAVSASWPKPAAGG